MGTSPDPVLRLKCGKCDSRFSHGVLADGLWLCGTCAKQTPGVVLNTSKKKKNGRGAGKAEWKRRLRLKECYYCGAPPPSTVDHVVPRSKGGADTPENTVAACADCNNKKADMDPEEWDQLVAQRKRELVLDKRTSPPLKSYTHRHLLNKERANMPEVVHKNIIRPKIVELTPDLAHSLLGRNTKNRNVRKKHVTKLAGAMKRGEWEFNGEAIKIGDNGIILDGQHRILAVIESGVTIDVLVIEGVNPKVQDTMDGGRARTLADALKLSGEDNVTILASALRILYSYEKTGLPPSVGNQQPSVRECLALLERHPGVRQSAEYAADNSKRSAKNFYPKSQIAGYHYIFSKAQGAENAEAFFYKLATGEELKIGDPIHTLRERLTSDLVGSHGQASSLGNKQKLAFIVRTFNGWMKGEELTRLLFNAGGAHPDRFPKVFGWEYTEHDNGSIPADTKEN